MVKVSQILEIDTAILSKLERGLRAATRDQVIDLADFFGINQEQLINKWLSEKIVSKVGQEVTALEAIKLAETEVAYNTKSRLSYNKTIKALVDLVKLDPRIKKAWIFGSLARSELAPYSDLDLMIEVHETSDFTLFDLAEIQSKGEQATGCKLDIGLSGSLYSFAQGSVNQDLRLIYEE